MTKENSDWLFGRNPVWEALKAERPLQQLLIAEGTSGGQLVRVLDKAKEIGLVIKRVPRLKLDQLAHGAKHQGVAAQIAAHRYAELDTVLTRVEAEGRDPFLVFLDGIEDPHNLGSILRTADAAAVDAVIIPKRRAVGLTATVGMVSAGAIEYVPVCRVTNIADTLKQLKKRDFWVFGSDAGGDLTLSSADFKGPLALVIGSEGKGLGPGVTKQCDSIVSLPMAGHVNSLNASVAAALLMYAAFQQRSS